MTSCCFILRRHGETHGSSPVPVLKASLPTWEILEFHQSPHIWKQQLFIPRVHVQASNVLNSQTSYRN